MQSQSEQAKSQPNVQTESWLFNVCIINEINNKKANVSY